MYLFLGLQYLVYLDEDRFAPKNHQHCSPALDLYSYIYPKFLHYFVFSEEAKGKSIYDINGYDWILPWTSLQYFGLSKIPEKAFIEFDLNLREKIKWSNNIPKPTTPDALEDARIYRLYDNLENDLRMGIFSYWP